MAATYEHMNSEKPVKIPAMVMVVTIVLDMTAGSTTTPAMMIIMTVVVALLPLKAKMATIMMTNLSPHGCRKTSDDTW